MYLMIKEYSQCDKLTGCGRFYDSALDKCSFCGNPEWSSNKVKIDHSLYSYDIECYPNFFSLGLEHIATGTYWSFECSPRKNDLLTLHNTLGALAKAKSKMVGYNNIDYDYQLVHFLLENLQFGIDHRHLYEKSQEIFSWSKDEKFKNSIWPDQRHIPQIDLMRIWHHDNKAKATALKDIEFNMRSENVADLPIKPGTMLTYPEMDGMHVYNKNDVIETSKFCLETMTKIAFREKLSAQHGKDFTNYSDTKIGSEYFTIKLEKANPGCTKRVVNGKKVKNQTYRPFVDIGEVIFDYIHFNDPEFNRIKDWLNLQRITETKGVFVDLIAKTHGIEYKFGTGGIHGSIESEIVRSNDDFVIIDVDVASYYPNLAIANNIYPEHLGAGFCNHYLDLYKERQAHPKKQFPTENQMLKLALNSVFGNSNNEYSIFLDPRYTMAITVNGQLLLCMLAEWLHGIKDLRMIQANTDGVTVYLRRKDVPTLRFICDAWERLTGLVLEDAEYKAMYIRDVNNYIAEYTDGKLKRKGAYCHVSIYDDPSTQDREWHQNHSALIIPKAAEAALVRGENIEDFIKNHPVDHDFMLKVKIPRNNRLELRTQFGAAVQQRITRAYVSNDGGAMVKVAPPPEGKVLGNYCKKPGVTNAQYNRRMAELPPNTWCESIHTKNKSVYKDRETSICKGYLMTECNKLSTFDRSNVNYNYYIDEAKKLVEVMR